MLCMSSNFGWKSFAQEVHFVKMLGITRKTFYEIYGITQVSFNFPLPKQTITAMDFNAE